MPKAPRLKRTTRATPISRGSQQDHKKADQSEKDPKASHLYTDDNPSTTIHGTGFSSAQKARDTLALIARRGPTYQFQVVNTMLHRARHHPSFSHSRGMQDAEHIFRQWLDDEYPRARAALHEYRPLLAKDALRRWLPALRDKNVDLSFADVYVDLGKGKQLANVLVDDKDPQGPDWERLRLEPLQALSSESRPHSHADLWDSPNVPTTWHARCLSWAWKPKPDATARRTS